VLKQRFEVATAVHASTALRRQQAGSCAVLKFEPSVLEDVPLIIQWQLVDESKADSLPFEFWLTGSADNPLTCKVCDSEGVVLFLRMDREGTSGLRMHTLFAVDNKTNRKRIASLLGTYFQGFAQQMRQFGDAITFESTSPHLVNFMYLLGFRHVSGDDYRLGLVGL
jgi:hypothetical protein